MTVCGQFPRCVKGTAEQSAISDAQIFAIMNGEDAKESAELMMCLSGGVCTLPHECAKIGRKLWENYVLEIPFEPAPPDIGPSCAYGHATYAAIQGYQDSWQESKLVHLHTATYAGGAGRRFGAFSRCAKFCLVASRIPFSFWKRWNSAMSGYRTSLLSQGGDGSETIHHKDPSLDQRLAL